MSVFSPTTLSQLSTALSARAAAVAAHQDGALRLFNGFFEGNPDLVIDLYAQTLVLHDYAGSPTEARDRQEELTDLSAHVRRHVPLVQTVLWKRHRSATLVERQGLLLHGERLDRRIREHGIRYAIDLRLHGETSFYLDTRNVRAWALQHLHGKRVLNTFAYTGSLGVAATAGGATQVIHLDHNRTFLNLAKESYALNGFPVRKADFQVGDFWTQVNILKRRDERFDCVVLDPPFFSTTKRGTVDLVTQSQRVINKVRPLIHDGGYLITINNALFVSGSTYLQLLEELCADGYLAIVELIPVPADCTGYPHTVVSPPPTDPAPFNHPTKIAVLRVRRKGN
ncbi:MAG: class I SAM-dependent methyltransferase [Candidatus Binatia bacterium]